MARIDAHQHFWKFDPVRDAWINDDMCRIQRDFFPEDLAPVLAANGIDGTIAVQADQSEAENAFLLGLAQKNDFIKGVVGWVDFCSPGIEERLHYYRSFPKMKGFRHVLQGEKDRAYMLLPDFKRGISLLHKYGYTYDILIYPDQLEYALAFCQAFPEQAFIIDHLAKPAIRANGLATWKKDITKFKDQSHVHCKVSGIVTEADWNNWTADEIYPYLDVVVDTFGINRLLFGSDWPVCLVAAEYNQAKALIVEYFAAFTPGENELLFGGNAERFYHLQ
ncbi:amidohydrolase family protein [Flavihumibacter fluvii]|uniref:amidohydrolase family protein n=1 Tax=Flavihumibacter fluvii TaxID=2838157 RepID=UPI001BDEB721|nr:amidohydrolase family protein [Flavihumibacter fluvii]ULQ54234.1 amidohydrolase family protein [Flavihumibacter fluvii]